MVSEMVSGGAFSKTLENKCFPECVSWTTPRGGPGNPGKPHSENIEKHSGFEMVSGGRLFRNA